METVTVNNVKGIVEVENLLGKSKVIETLYLILLPTLTLKSVFRFGF